MNMRNDIKFSYANYTTARTNDDDNDNNKQQEHGAHVLCFVKTTFIINTLDFMMVLVIFERFIENGFFYDAQIC